MEQLFNVQKLYTSILVTGFHYVKHQKGWSYPAHRHHQFEFIYCASGSIEQWVNGQPYTLTEGDALIVKCGMFHHTAPLTDTTELFIFHFDIDVKEVHAIFQINQNPHIQANQNRDEAFSIQHWVKDFISQYKELLIRHIDNRAKTDERLSTSLKLLRMQTRILDFIGLLAEHFVMHTDLMLNNNIRPSQINLVHEVAYQLELHSGERLQIGELAKQMGVHRSYLSICFKQVYGISPKDYLTKIKVRTAKQLILNTNFTVEEIAANMEFSSTSHFSKFFQNAVGLSPLKYRNQFQR